MELRCCYGCLIVRPLQAFEPYRGTQRRRHCKSCRTSIHPDQKWDRLTAPFTGDAAAAVAIIPDGIDATGEPYVITTI